MRPVCSGAFGNNERAQDAAQPPPPERAAFLFRWLSLFQPLVCQDSRWSSLPRSVCEHRSL